MFGHLIIGVTRHCMQKHSFYHSFHINNYANSKYKDGYFALLFINELLYNKRNIMYQINKLIFDSLTSSCCLYLIKIINIYKQFQFIKMTQYICKCISEDFNKSC